MSKLKMKGVFYTPESFAKLMKFRSVEYVRRLCRNNKDGLIEGVRLGPTSWRCIKIGSVEKGIWLLYDDEVTSCKVVSVLQVK